MLKKKESKTIDWSVCKGCEVFSGMNQSYCDGDSRPEFFGRQCPCVDCLLKMRCSKKCDKYDSFLSFLHSYSY
jgi:hypothetical protein